MRYLAYGSNMSSARIAERLGRCEFVGSARVEGYRLAFHKRGHDGSGKCDACRSEDDAIMYGVVFELSHEQAQQLDGFEGPNYERRILKVSIDGCTSEAYAYIALPSAVDFTLRPYPWYRAFVLDGALLNRLPAGYVDFIRRYPTIPDPDAMRQAANEKILEKRGRCRIHCG